MFTNASPALDRAHLMNVAHDIGTPCKVLPLVRTSTEPTVRADVIDATLDAYMIARLVRDYGCSKRDIANTFGASRLGKCAPIWFDAALVATMHSKWSAF